LEKGERELREKTCFFTGHRDIPKEKYAQIQEDLETAARGLIAEGVIYFAVGGATGFDTLAAMTILKLKEEFSEARLVLILPCKNHNFSWQGRDLRLFEGIQERADKVVYTAERYYNGCMYKRNRYMAEGSGYCVCYMDRDTGGTAYTVNYALSMGVRVINLAQLDA